MIQDKTTQTSQNLFKPNSRRILFIALILAVIVIGVVYRSTGINNSLWLDEAAWAQKLINNSLLKSTFRPIGFMAITKVLISIRNNEFTLRFIPYLSSIFAIFLIYLIAKEIYKSKITILLSVFIVSFNPILISFAKEFKPYSLELSIHLLAILVMLLYIKKKIYLTPYHITGILLIALLFDYNIVFIYPSAFLLLLIEAYQREKTKYFFTLLFTLICIVCLGVGLVVVDLLLLYYVFGTDNIVESSKLYWGNKYHVFYLSNDPLNHIKWIIGKYSELILSSGRAKVFWNFMDIKYTAHHFRRLFGTDITGGIIIDALLLIAHSIGLAVLIIKKKIKYLLIFVVPVFVVILFNVSGIWPFGPFRTNLFLYCYFIIISLYGIDVVVNTSRTRFNRCMIFFIVIIFIVLQLPFEPEYYKLKTGIPNSDMKSVLNTIFNMDNMDRLSQIENPERQERIIIAERHSYSQIKYYLENHSEFSRKNRGEIRNYKISMVQRMREINARNFFNSRGPVWIVNSDPRDINKSDKYLVKSNIMFQQIFKENQNELICYLPHTLSNILTFNNKNGFKGISPISEMAIKSEMRSGKEVLVARSKGKNTFLEFPEIQYPKDRFLSISARMESPTQTDLCIFYMTESDKQYTQSKSVCIWIDYGQNNLNAIINDKNIYGKILLSPGKASGDYIISEISIDAVDR